MSVTVPTPASVRRTPITAKRTLTVRLSDDGAYVLDYTRGHGVAVECRDLPGFAVGDYADVYEYIAFKAEREACDCCTPHRRWVVEAVQERFDREVSISGRKVEVEVTMVDGHWNARDAVRAALRVPRRPFTSQSKGW